MNLWTKEALRYREMGMSVFPCNGDKRPTVKWTPFKSRKPTQREIRSMFSASGVQGIAVVCGPVSGGLSCRDYDDAESYREWKREYPEESGFVPTVETFRGSHVWVIGPELFVKMPDGEYRGTSKQYVMLPPSVHPKTSEPYRWTVHPYDAGFPTVIDLHGWGLLDTKLVGKGNRYNNSSIVSLTPYTNSVLLPPVRGLKEGDVHGWMLPDSVRKLAAIHQPERVGQRNVKILDYVRSLLRLPGIEWTRFRARVAFGQWWLFAVDVVGTNDEAFSLWEFYRAWELCPEQGKGLDVDRLRLVVEEYDVGFAEIIGDAEMLFKGCLHLQGVNGDGGFFISKADAGRFLGRSDSYGRTMMQKLIAAGLVEKVWTGSNLSGRANWYRCLLPSR